MWWFDQPKQSFWSPCSNSINMKPNQRLQLAQNTKLCINCLKTNHKTKQCPSLKNCHRCNKRHHTLLHLDTQYHKEEHTKPSPSTKQQYNSAQSGSTSSSLFATPSHERSSVLLSTAVLMVDDAFGNQVECRAILHSGSQINLITKEFANRLGLEQVNHHLRIQGVGEAHHNASKSVNIHISSKITSFNTRLEALVLPTIVSQQPRQAVQINNWKIPKNIKLGDLLFNVLCDVDMLIGAGIFYSILSIGQIKLGKGQPILQNTLLGWLVSGQHTPTSTYDEAAICGMCA